ncbi:MAG: hypothetical protein ACOYKE_12470 [Ferruginibacter sp.]
MEDKLNNIRYSLKMDFFDSTEDLKNQYNRFVYHIKKDGFFTFSFYGKNAKVYTPELLMFFWLKEIAVNSLVTISGVDYWETYVNAFNEGEKYFDREFLISVDTLYGRNAEQYVKDIHLNYFHLKHTTSLEGWFFVKNYYPTTISHDEIKKYGYYSGIVSRVDALVKKHVKIFAEFDKCEHNQIQDENVNTDSKSIAETHLECLSGYWKGRKIMSDNEYKRLIDYANYTIEHNEIPKNIKPIQKGFSGLSKAFYQHSIYRVWKNLNLADKSVIQITWINFATNVFKDQYRNVDTNTLTKKFSEYKGGYQQDKALITYEVI